MSVKQFKENIPFGLNINKNKKQIHQKNKSLLNFSKQFILNKKKLKFMQKRKSFISLIKLK